MSIASILIFVLFFISILGLILSRNTIKSIVLIMLCQTSIVLYWLYIGGSTGTRPPMLDESIEYVDPYLFSDPLPQALMLTAIVIGISVAAIMITMLSNIIRKYKTADWEKIKELSTQVSPEDEYA